MKKVQQKWISFKNIKFENCATLWGAEEAERISSRTAAPDIRRCVFYLKLEVMNTVESTEK